MSNTKCTSLSGALLGHKFEPRYSSGSATISPIGEVSLVLAKETAVIIESSKPKTYHCDVCVRCGLVVNKQGGVADANN